MDHMFPVLLEHAQKSGMSFTAYFESVGPENPAPGQTPTVEGAVQEVLYLLEHYGKHPAWLKVDGKPVLFIYERALTQIGGAGWNVKVAMAAMADIMERNVTFGPDIGADGEIWL
jgi:hypothetical protein